MKNSVVDWLEFKSVSIGQGFRINNLVKNCINNNLSYKLSEDNSLNASIGGLTYFIHNSRLNTEQKDSLKLSMSN
jgi:hypothetical protein